MFDSPLIVGTMRLGEWGAKMDSQQLENFVDHCLENGLVDFDHADIYGDYSEEAHFGELIARRPDLKSKLKITTKCGIKMLSERRPDHQLKSYDSTKEHIIWSAENSLKQLNIDQIELLLIHRPDYLMEPDEIAEAFTQLKSSGKVKFFGVSNFSTSQFSMLNDYFKLDNHQIEISISYRTPFKNGLLDQCIKHRITPTAWSPFGGGAIFSEEGREDFNRIRKVTKKLSEKYDAKTDQILLAWLMKHPSGIVPILGTTKTERVDSALKATKINLTNEEWYMLLEAAEGQRVP